MITEGPIWLLLLSVSQPYFELAGMNLSELLLWDEKTSSKYAERLSMGQTVVTCKPQYPREGRVAH